MATKEEIINRAVVDAAGGPDAVKIAQLEDEIERLRAENTNLRRWKALDKPLTAAMEIANSHIARQSSLPKLGGMRATIRHHPMAGTRSRSWPNGSRSAIMSRKGTPND